MAHSIKIRTDLEHAQTRLSNAQEFIKAGLVDKDTYPQNTQCAVCGERWLAHFGELCPDTSSHTRENIAAVYAGRLPMEILAFKPRGTAFLPLLEGATFA